MWRRWGGRRKIDIKDPARRRPMPDEGTVGCKHVAEVRQRDVGTMLGDQALDVITAAPITPATGEVHDRAGVLGKGN
jgi:hypothetical protein